MRARFRVRLFTAFAALALVVGPIGWLACGPTTAIVKTNPTADEVQSLRVQAIRVADEVARAIDIAQGVTRTMQALTQSADQPGNPIPAAVMIAVDRAGIVAATKLKAALTLARDATSNPSLQNSAKMAVDALADFVAALPSARPELRIAIAILQGALPVSVAVVKGS